MKVTMSATSPLPATKEGYDRLKKLSAYFGHSINDPKQVKEALQYGLNYYMKSPQRSSSPSSRACSKHSSTTTTAPSSGSRIWLTC